jgi:hypothetical protein
MDETDGQTRLTPEELLDLKPSLATRDQLNEVESLGINQARTWAMRRVTLRRDDLLTDHFAPPNETSDGSRTGYQRAYESSSMMRSFG